MKPLPPKTLLQDRYLIQEIIGKGGMGEVYLATDSRLGNEVALKRTTVGDDEQLAAAFEREARTLAGLRHPVLPKVSDHFLEQDEQFLVMDYIDGEDLSQRLKAANKPFPLNWVLFWADQLLDALSYLHTFDPPIIHRDIKPQNLKLSGDNQIVLLDFGLSKNTLGETRVTTSGSVVGYTPHYAPMEQIRGTGTNAKSDLYALSATFYQLLSNSVPPDALTRADSLLANLPDPLLPLSQLNPEVSDGLSAAIAKGMDISQDRRFETARDMQKALRKAYNLMQQTMEAETVASDAGSDSKVAEVFAAVEPDVSPTVETSSPAEEARLDSGTYETDEFEAIEDVSGEKTEVFNLADLSETPDPAELPVVPVPDIPEEPVFDAGALKTELVHDQKTQSRFPEEPSSEPVFAALDQIPDDSGQGDQATYDPAADQVFDAETAPEISTLTAEEVSQDESLQEESLGFAEVPVDEEQPTPPVIPPKKSSTGKYLGILAGVGLVLLLIAGASAAALWYLWPVGGGTVEPEPAPTIETTTEPTAAPTVEESLTPEATPDETNINTKPDATPAGPSPGKTVQATPEPRKTTAPRVTPKKPPVTKPTAPVTKPTNKPKDPGVL